MLADPEFGNSGERGGRNVEDKPLAKAGGKVLHADAPFGVNDLDGGLLRQRASRKADVQNILGRVGIGRNVGCVVLDTRMAYSEQK